LTEHDQQGAQVAKGAILMGRWILAVSSAAAIVAAVVVGPLGTSAAPPYVYGCTPAAYNNATGYILRIDAYNGSATTSNATLKALAGDGTIITTFLGGIPATKTFVAGISVPANSFPSSSSSTIPGSVRVVSNVPLVATISHLISAGVNQPIGCAPLLP
jgi:hypothetical protein